MTVRFADILLSDAKAPTVTDRQDFVVRKRRPVWQVLAFMFTSVLVSMVILGMLIKDITVFVEVIFFILVVLGTYIVYIIQQSRDLVLATEFQNSLFSSALSHSNKFCIIIKNDNSIAYIDHSLQEMFPNFYKEPRRDIDVLFEMGRVSLEDRKTVFAALERRVRDKVIFDITDYKKQSRRIIMSIEPISRPKGFMLMRGHEFVEKRVLGPQIDNSKLPLFDKNNLNLFSYVMDSMDIGTYMVDLFGRITYANLTLEQWLDFEENELAASDLSLRDIISQIGLDIAVSDIKNFEGDITLQRKIGGHMKAKLTQKAMYDEQGAVTGYAGLIYPMKDPSLKPKTSKNENSVW